MRQTLTKISRQQFEPKQHPKSSKSVQ